MFVSGKQKWDKFVIVVEKELPIKDILREELGFSARSISRIKRDKNIFVDGKFRKVTLSAYPGEEIEIPIVAEPSGFNPQDCGVDYLYEDFDLIVADKPPYMVVHPTKSHFDSTLANDVVYKLSSKGEHPRVSFVNRLDMNTSGIVVIAKNGFAHHRLSQDMASDSVHKEYIAVVHGIVEEDSGLINLPIYRESDDSIKRCVDKRGQESKTEFEVIKRLDNASVLRLRLLTGRTHQIRVHLSHLGHPIYGDELYGISDDGMDRQALHAYRIGFKQPRMGSRIDVVSNLPEDILSLIERLGGNRDDYK